MPIRWALAESWGAGRSDGFAPKSNAANERAAAPATPAPPNPRRTPCRPGCGGATGVQFRASRVRLRARRVQLRATGVQLRTGRVQLRTSSE
ncbi:hypothetical protein GCM10025780_01930 [Frondihabitans cladoniiphilus]|uniref:Uncharacterized protein n=1 Tax=Frondihabitans cladoniiphilus TaxID=715785 RepID=A0ABP8VIR6_9MICO